MLLIDKHIYIYNILLKHKLNLFISYPKNLVTVLWTLWERERVGRFGRMALKHVKYHV